MPDFSTRCTDAEIMDDLDYAGGLMDKTLRELEIINKWLGGNAVTFSALSQLLKEKDHDATVRIADLGCGRGDMLALVDGWASKRGIKTALTGIDANPYIIRAAEHQLKNYPHIRLLAQNIFSPAFREQKFDVVIGTLFYHHFTQDQLTAFFAQLKNQCTKGFIINDIHRHPLAYYSIKWLTQAFSRSSMVQYDAPLSVLRAFKKEELLQCLENAGIKKYSIRWKWAFRWQVVVWTI
ncbi:Ubiquinone/menaquinone biosynthesis C-methylase UbiE [Chryseolinea serpens]|uniref:Ubiquinone/menaquinone biosynthesis C-methylase UbiE n=1 Tax=Chryseolinea serpens TaxID=947013 RepID=A0A1M5XMJ5_9BACT|nr:methyltransferase domain-containing protein [Chryseolinea serpens]SHI00463.1 Ubiquinone/menaquinone biosynthesis C-methylase UbiE [Chryseolinea serpens]